MLASWWHWTEAENVVIENTEIGCCQSQGVIRQDSTVGPFVLSAKHHNWQYWNFSIVQGNSTVRNAN